MGIQVHGGMGYVEETGAAQHLCDARITTIYEGTTAIQANDFLGRKIIRDRGVEAFKLLEDQFHPGKTGYESRLPISGFYADHLPTPSVPLSAVARSSKNISEEAHLIVENRQRIKRDSGVRPPRGPLRASEAVSLVPSKCFRDHHSTWEGFFYCWSLTFCYPGCCLLCLTRTHYQQVPDLGLLCRKF